MGVGFPHCYTVFGPFTVYYDIYLDHIKGLKEIKAKKPQAYVSLMWHLFRLASYVYPDLSALFWLT